MTEAEKLEVRQLLDAHQRTVEICRACANTARDLAWEVKRGSVPDADTLKTTIAEAERVLDDLGKIEIAIARLRAALW
jgi:hypothetical protein